MSPKGLALPRASESGHIDAEGGQGRRLAARWAAQGEIPGFLQRFEGFGEAGERHAARGLEILHRHLLPRSVGQDVQKGQGSELTAAAAGASISAAASLSGRR